MAPLLLILATLTLGTLSTVQAAIFKPKGPVVELTSSNFKREVLDIEKPTFVAFTAPWCGHCQRLVPEYERAAETLSGVIKFANIDCDAEKNKPTCGQYGVQGFPTIKMFPATKKRLAKDYQGERNAKALADYAVGELPLAAVKKLEAPAIQNFADKDASRVKVLLFTNKPVSSPLYKSIALDYRRSITFASVRGDQPAVRSAARVHLGLDIPSDKDLPKLIMLPARISPSEHDSASPSFEKGSFVTYEGKLNYRELKVWIDEKGKELGAKARSEEESKRKQPREAKWAKPKDQPPPGAVPPEGGSIEWRAENIEFGAKGKAAKEGKKEEKKQKEEEAPSMLSKERAEELLSGVNKQKEAMMERLAVFQESEGATNASEGVAKLKDKLSEKLQDAGAAAAESVASATEAVADTVSSLTQRFAAEASPSPTGGVILDNPEDATSDKEEDTPSTLSKEDAEEMLSEVNKYKGDAMERLGLYQASDAAANASEAAAKLKDKLAEKLQNAGAAAAESAASATDAVADSVSSMTERFSAEASPSPTGGSIIDKVKDTASDAGSYVAEKAGDAADAGTAAADPAASVTEAVADFAASLVGRFYGEASPSSTGGSIIDKVKDTASGAGGYVSEKVGDATKASADMLSNVADAVLDDDYGSAADDVRTADTDEQELPDAAQVVLDAIKGKLGGKKQEAVDDDEQLAYNMHGDADAEDFVAKKPGEVLGAFADYISGKPTIWSSDMTEEVRRAKEDAEKLYKTDPAKAAEKAREMEEWLHTNLDIDKDKMAGELGVDGVEKLENLQKILKQRIEQRESSKKHKIPRHEEL